MNENHLKCQKYGNKKQNFGYLDLTLLIFSFLSIVLDGWTDVILAIEYYQSDHKQWAWITFSLLFVASLLVQLISLRWYDQGSDEQGNWFICIFHCLCLGLYHRFYYVIQMGLEARKTKEPSDYHRLWSAQSDINLLHLFASFLESAPQLVLQLYIIATLQEISVMTGLCVASSVFSLILSLVTYTLMQRTAYNNQLLQLPNVVVQVLWRLGMLTARICALVLLILCFQVWFFLFIVVHWLSMFLWILYQNTHLCDNKLEERCYNGIVAIIYCFCFFNLKDGRSRWRILSFYSLLLLQNLTSLTIFLMGHAEDTPTLDVIAFVAVIGGTVIGLASMALYYRFFHPSTHHHFGIKDGSVPPHTQSNESHTIGRSLKRLRWVPYKTCSIATVSTNDMQRIDLHLSLSNAKLALTDSVVIVEESDMEELNTLQNWLKEAMMEEQMRANGCSSLDLDEAASSILSAHDYENLAAVNITRSGELRHWRGYYDIETYLHDDSIVRGTLTSTTGSSSQDYLDTIVEDYQDCKLSADPVGMFAPSSLDTILEEAESISSEQSRSRGPCTLVATIDQIRITTPVHEERRQEVRRKFSIIRDKFEAQKDAPELSTRACDRAQSPLRISVKEMRAFFLRQVLTPPKLAALRRKATTSLAP